MGQGVSDGISHLNLNRHGASVMGPPICLPPVKGEPDGFIVGISLVGVCLWHESPTL